MAGLLILDLIYELHDAVMNHRIARDKLLLGIHPGFVSTLQRTSDDRSQIFLDLGRLNTVPKLTDGSVPLEIWLRNALYNAKAEGQAGWEIYERALAKIRNDSPTPPPTPPPAKPKILFLSANPIGRDQLAIGREFKAVGDAVRNAPDGRDLPLIPAFDIGAGDLSQALLEHEPTILHFSGHGDPTGKLVVTSRLGGGDKMEAEALAGLLESFKAHLRCVVLNACFSEIVAKALRQHIDCVVGMSRAISDEAAVQFATGFYRFIAFHKDVNTAFKQACIHIDIAHLSEADKPQLLCKDDIDPNTLILFPKSS